jgi:hypothetical protein
MAITPITPPLKSDVTKLNQASAKWLMGRLNVLKAKQTVPGAFNPVGYTNPKHFMTGEMFIFHYDPKLKNALPYYDTFPLVIPIALYGDGFLGLNLHYLPPTMRASFLNKLIAYANTSPGDTRIRMNITYDILKNAQNLNAYLPCIKRYLVDHIRGRMVRLQPHEWPLVVNLPYEAFQKASKAKVWADSRKKIRGA